MPLTRDEGNALAELLATIRPAWNTRGIITKGLVPLMKHPAPIEVITWAAIRATRNPDNRTPAVIPLNGPHWNLADRPPEPRLTPEDECQLHPGQWAGNCRSCAVDDHGHPGDPSTEPLDGNGTPRENAIARAKHAAQTARHALAGHRNDDDQEEDPTGSPKPSPSSEPTTTTAPPNTPPPTTNDTPTGEDNPPKHDDEWQPETPDPVQTDERTQPHE